MKNKLELIDKLALIALAFFALMFCSSINAQSYTVTKIDNNYEILEYNSIQALLNLNKFSTSVKFVEENGITGDTNSIENTLSYSIDDQNFLKFATRRNRKINLTEYYDLMYEYKNDCLIAGFKYKNLTIRIEI